MKNQITNAETGALSISGLLAQSLNMAIRQPIVLVVIVAIITGLGLYLNWPTVVALGLAPLVLTFAPCALMCALSLCGMAANKKRSDSEPPTEDDKP